MEEKTEMSLNKIKNKKFKNDKELEACREGIKYFFKHLSDENLDKILNNDFYYKDDDVICFMIFKTIPTETTLTNLGQV